MPALETFRSTLQPVLDEALASHGVPGATVGIRRGDESVVVAGGLTNVDTGVEVTPDTLFQIGSISKAYTATLVLQLVHAGLVALDEPVRGALQEFRVADDAATLTITPRQLLAHTSGIQGDHFLDCGRNPDALWRFVSTLEDVGQIHPPDDLFSYCNAGYGVLGRLVEEATGDHFARSLQRRLIRPLGLTQTVALAEQAIVHRVAVGHRYTEDDTVHVAPWVLSRFNVPIGGLICSAGDVLEFAALHLRGGRGADDKQVLPTKAIAQMRASEVSVPGRDEEWGLGWRLERWGDTDVIGHDGDTVGQRAFLRLFPDADTAVTVLTNSPKGDHVADAVLEAVASELLHISVPALPEPIPVDERAERVHADHCTGIYERMHQRVAVAGGADGTLRMTVIPDELFLKAGLREHTLTLTPIDDVRWLTTDPATGVAQIVAMVGQDDEGDDVDGDGEPAAPEAPAYVHFGRRAHARIS